MLISCRYSLRESNHCSRSRPKAGVSLFLLLTKLADVKVLHGLVNRWLQDLKDDVEEPLQARFNFKNNLVGSVNQISCNLYISVNPIIDGFYPCQVLYVILLCQLYRSSTCESSMLTEKPSWVVDFCGHTCHHNLCIDY